MLLIGDLSWSLQVESVCQKAWRILGLLAMQEILWPSIAEIVEAALPLSRASTLRVCLSNVGPPPL